MIFLLLLLVSGAHHKAWTAAGLALGAYLLLTSFAIGPLVSILFVGTIIPFVIMKRSQRVVGPAAGTLLVSGSLLMVPSVTLVATFADDLAVLLGRDATSPVARSSGTSSLS